MKRYFAIFCTALLLLSLCACGSTASVQSSSSSASMHSAAPLQSASAGTSSDRTQDTYEVGGTATLGDWAITVTACDFKDTISDSSGYGKFTPDDGNKFIVISASITNNGKQSETFLPSFSTNEDVSAIINYSDGYEYQLTNLIGHDASLVNATMNPLTSKDGIIAFEAPNAVISGAESLTLTFSIGEQNANFSLR